MIRQATRNDLDDIYCLYQQSSLDISRVDDSTYSAQIQRDGFLVALDESDAIAKRIENDFLFHVYEQDGNVIGFIDVNKEEYFPEDADNCIWLDEELKGEYFHGRTSITLHEIIVDKNHQKEGVGTRLLENSINVLREKRYDHLFSIITIAPVTNCPSLIFHTKNGFERACVTMPFDLFGLKNYMSLLFHKKI